MKYGNVVVILFTNRATHVPLGTVTLTLLFHALYIPQLPHITPTFCPVVCDAWPQDKHAL